MLKSFQLGAIIKQKNQWELQSFSLRDSLQNTFADEWERQYKAFDEKEETEFRASYKPDEDECFISPYKLPEWLADINSKNTRNIKEISLNRILASSIKGIVAFAQDDENNELMLFQNFSRRQIIQQKTSLLYRGDTFEGIEGKILGFDDKLRAIYLPNEGKLLFDNLHLAKRFLPLSDIYDDASNKDILEILDHDLFECADSQMVLNYVTQQIRIGFGKLKASGRLEHFAAVDIKKKASLCEIDVQIQEDKILFPTEVDQAKELLQFLNDGIFRSAITGDLLESNSIRPYRKV